MFEYTSVYMKIEIVGRMRVKLQVFFMGGAYLVADNDRFAVAVYGSHRIKE